VLALTPSEYLSENEIAAALMANQGERFNPQQQFEVTWPASPVVARAYIDQLERDDALSDSMAAELAAALDQAESGAGDRKLARELKSLAKALQKEGGDGVTAKRRAGLAETLSGIAAGLR